MKVDPKSLEYCHRVVSHRDSTVILCVNDANIEADSNEITDTSKLLEANH